MIRGPITIIRSYCLRDISLPVSQQQSPTEVWLERSSRNDQHTYFGGGGKPASGQNPPCSKANSSVQQRLLQHIDKYMTYAHLHTAITKQLHGQIHQETPVPFKRLARKWFGEYISRLFLSLTVHHPQHLFLDQLPDKVVPYVYVLCPACAHGVFSQRDCSLVVLKHITVLPEI